MRVWIGCLACYNGGDLVGKWYDADEADEVTPSDVHGRDMGVWVRGHDGRGVVIRREEIHEELWVFDVDEAPHESLCREMSPVEAAEIATTITHLESRHIDIEAYAAYSDIEGYSFGLVEPDDFEDAFCGVWDDREDYAYNLADDLGAVPRDYSWPASYIDWQAAARDLFMDHFDAPASGGRIYVFRHI